MDNDLYGLLGIKPSANAGEVRRAYFKLAKKLHPDRQVQADPQATERFLAVQSAYEVLIDPERRDEYDRRKATEKLDERPVSVATAAAPDDPSPTVRAYVPRADRGPTIDEARDARLAFEKARVLFDTGQLDKALRAMHAVVRTVPDQPDYQSFLGYLMALDGERLHAARDHCRRAVEAEPFNPEFHARLGFVYAKAGLQNTAEKCFEEALSRDPSNAIALRYRGKNGVEGAPGAGLVTSFKRLFGRHD